MEPVTPGKADRILQTLNHKVLYFVCFHLSVAVLICKNYFSDSENNHTIFIIFGNFPIIG